MDLQTCRRRSGQGCANEKIKEITGEGRDAKKQCCKDRKDNLRDLFYRIFCNGGCADALSATR